MNAIFDYLKKIFNENGFRLFMIGGTSRDYLLDREMLDYDFVSEATPLEIKKFMDVDMTFQKFGTVKYFYNNKKIDITTLRIEGDYKDGRHPSFIKFVKDLNLDFVRRDFTINALYIDENYHIVDPTTFGLNDLYNRKLRFIGDPLTRIKEDPLRILRAMRFIEEYELEVDENIKKILIDNYQLIELLNKDKIIEEKKKMAFVRRNLRNDKNEF